MGKKKQDGIDPAESGREATDAELSAAGFTAADFAGGADLPTSNIGALKDLSPAQDSIETARQMMEAGTSERDAAQWLARNCPDVFADAESAGAAILAE